VSREPAGSPALVALRELAWLPPGTRVALQGRLLPGPEGIVALVHDGASVQVRGPGLPAELCLVRVWGMWRGHVLDAEGSELLGAPSTPRPLREHACFAYVRDGQRRMARLRERARILRHVRAFFEARGFLEVDTPLVVPSPGLDVHLDALAVEGRGRETRYLITSPEYQMKRLLACGFGPIFQLAKCFRNDEVGERHQPEFSMLEWYRPYQGVADVMADTEALVASVAELVSGTPVLHTAAGPIDVRPPWPRLTVHEAFRRFAGIELDAILHDETRTFEVLVDQVEPRLAELGAVLLCDYPLSMASLARKSPHDPRLAERFEAYVGGVELCNGFGELTDPREQRARLEHDRATRRAQALPVYPIDERFLAALEDGMPPSGGNALGIDRLVMLALGAGHIEDVLALPHSAL
jgi:lysyl-tRNA synthetase class 2